MHDKGTGRVGPLHPTGFYCKYSNKFMKYKKGGSSCLESISNMASPVLKFEGIEAYHINPDILERTVKIVPVDQGPRKQMSYGDVFNSLCDAGIKGKEVGWIYKVSHSDYSFLYSWLTWHL